MFNPFDKFAKLDNVIFELDVFVHVNISFCSKLSGANISLFTKLLNILKDLVTVTFTNLNV